MSKAKSEVKKSYGIKKTWVSLYTERAASVAHALEDYQTSLGVCDALNKIDILLSICPGDVQKHFAKDIKHIEELLFTQPSKATGITSSLRSEHAMQILHQIGREERQYARQLLRDVVLILDKKGLIDMTAYEISSNY